jgi:hypothetical protein
MRLKDDATTRDHCRECNNGILGAMVATIDSYKALQALTRAIRLMTDGCYIIKMIPTAKSKRETTFC